MREAMFSKVMLRVSHHSVWTGHLYVKIDIYSFMMVLVELLTRMRTYYANHPTAQQLLVEWAKPHLSKMILTRIMDS